MPRVKCCCGRLVPTDTHPLDVHSPFCHERIIAGLREDLEDERMRLAACSMIALADTPESAEKARKMHERFRSPVHQEIERLVDEVMKLRMAEAMAWPADLCATCKGAWTLPLHSEEEGNEEKCPNPGRAPLADTGDYYFICGCPDVPCNDCAAGRRIAEEWATLRRVAKAATPCLTAGGHVCACCSKAHKDIKKITCQAFKEE